MEQNLRQKGGLGKSKNLYLISTIHSFVCCFWVVFFSEEKPITLLSDFNSLAQTLCW